MLTEKIARPDRKLMLSMQTLRRLTAGVSAGNVRCTTEETGVTTDNTCKDRVFTDNGCKDPAEAFRHPEVPLARRP